MPSRVLLVDDHELIRQGLSSAFGRQEDFVVVGEAGCLADAKQKSEHLTPDVVLTDVRLPDGSGLELVRYLRQRRKEAGIVVLTMYAGDSMLLEALDAGASAFVYKDARTNEILAAARHAVLSPLSFTAPNLSAVMRRAKEPVSPRLSPRETAVLHLLSQGFEIAEVAQRLYISVSTVKTHTAKIYDKLGANNRAQAVLTATQCGILRQPSDSFV
jgi:DNA-binding NarL/FixJ family response regulator